MPPEPPAAQPPPFRIIICQTAGGAACMLTVNPPADVASLSAKDILRALGYESLPPLAEIERLLQINLASLPAVREPTAAPPAPAAGPSPPLPTPGQPAKATR